MLLNSSERGTKAFTGNVMEAFRENASQYGATDDQSLQNCRLQSLQELAQTLRSGMLRKARSRGTK